MTEGSPRCARSVLLVVFFVVLQVCGRVPVVSAAFYGPPSHQDLVDQVLHHIFESRIGLKLFHCCSPDAALCEGIRVVHQTIDD